MDCGSVVRYVVVCTVRLVVVGRTVFGAFVLLAASLQSGKAGLDGWQRVDPRLEIGRGFGGRGGQSWTGGAWACRITGGSN